MAASNGGSPSGSAWQELKLGAGGFLTSEWVDQGGSGTYYVRTDGCSSATSIRRRMTIVLFGLPKLVSG
jgi:hypothetical protein